MSKKVLIVDIGNTATEFAIFDGGNSQEFLGFFKFPNQLEDAKKTLISCKNRGFSIDDATKLNEEISAELDKEDYIDEEYYLEVSSEGVEKELRNDKDITNAVGLYIFAKFYEKIDHVKEIYGDLESFDGNTLQIKYNVKGRIKHLTVKKEQICKIRLAIKF